MTHAEDQLQNRLNNRAEKTLVLRVTDHEFQRAVLEKIGRLETKIDTLVGNGQPGRMTLAERRITDLERSDIRRNVVDRVVSAAIAMVTSAAIALHDHLGIR